MCQVGGLCKFEKDSLAGIWNLDLDVYRLKIEEKKRKEKSTLFSDHNGSLLRRQPGAMTVGHSPKGKEKSST